MAGSKKRYQKNKGNKHNPHAGKTVKKSGALSGLKIILLTVFLVAAGLLVLKFFPSKSVNKRNHFIPGPANTCEHSPSLITTNNLQQPVALDFSQRGFTGMRLIEVRQDGSGRVLQLPSWDDAGHLGLYAMDRDGNVYTTPVPHVSLLENPPEQQNKVYKIDSRTGDMKVFVDLPWAKPPSINNPYGALGVTYDCDTESLYVSSIAGSGRKDEVGRIFQVDIRTAEIVDIFEGIDAIGVGVFTTKSGKKLFCGSAREPDIYSIDLNPDGSFAGTPQFVLSLIEQEGGSYDKGHRIRFFKDNRMEIKGIDFNYSLMAASDPMRNIYNFQYDETSDEWKFLEVNKQ